MECMYTGEYADYIAIGCDIKSSVFKTMCIACMRLCHPICVKPTYMRMDFKLLNQNCTAAQRNEVYCISFSHLCCIVKWIKIGKMSE